MEEVKGYYPKLIPNGGFVHAEINKDTSPIDDTGLPVSYIQRSFGNIFQGAPKQSDWIRARKWLKHHMRMLKENEDLL